MGRRDDISGIQSTLSDAEHRASILQTKIAIEEADQKYGPIERHMRIAIVGPPGSGKTTQAAKLKKRLCICHLPIGQILRSQISKRSPDVKSARDIMERGGLVTDETMIDLIRSEIDNNVECKNGFILDDFPRNVTEARLLDEMLESRNQPLHRAIELSVPDVNLLDSRITGRLVHLASGRIYHTIFHPPKQDMKDDITGEPLIHRSYDAFRNTRERLSIYRQEVSPISEYYRGKGIWRDVDGSSGPVQVCDSIMNAIYK